jgi:hypothetical protein
MTSLASCSLGGKTRRPDLPDTTESTSEDEEVIMCVRLRKSGEAVDNCLTFSSTSLSSLLSRLGSKASGELLGPATG